MFKELGEFIDETLGINSKKCKEKIRKATREEIDAMCGNVNGVLINYDYPESDDMIK